MITYQQLETFLAGNRVVAVIGGQWGDEAKGKFVDILASWSDVVARGTGGDNAGHTIKANDTQVVLHQIPSGILRDEDDVVTVCGSGMVINPQKFIEELEALKKAKITYRNLKLAHNACLILPQHVLLDQLREALSKDGKIGTTGRGIGPAYTDKVGRVGLIVNDLLNEDNFRVKLTKNLEEKTKLLGCAEQPVLEGLLEKSPYGRFYQIGKGFNLDAILDTYLGYGGQLKEMVADTDKYMQDRAANGHSNILLEGAQGWLLNVNNGTHPYVTSSDCSVAGLAQGVGLHERDVNLTVMVAKAPYMSRVGHGPFPTELGGKESEVNCNASGETHASEQKRYPNASLNSDNPYEQGVAIRQAGNEYGSTTGRPRRVGWLDLVLLRHVVRHTGGKVVLALTKLDVLDECREFKLCLGYSYAGPGQLFGGRCLHEGDQITEPYLQSEVLRNCRPILTAYPGWQCAISGLRSADKLPAAIMSLIGLIERGTGANVAFVSVGPDRDQTILVAKSV